MPKINSRGREILINIELSNTCLNHTFVDQGAKI